LDFCKTYAETAPHEYLLKKGLSDEDKLVFEEFVKFINNYGYEKYFYNRPFKYLDIGDKKYWTMEKDLSKTELINRADKD
jgi:hypothetical protein